MNSYERQSIWCIYTFTNFFLYFFCLYCRRKFYFRSYWSKNYPYIVSFFLITSSLFLIFKPDIKPKWPEFGKIIEILMTALILIMYAVFLPIIGFVFSTFFASSFISWRLGAKFSAFTAV